MANPKRTDTHRPSAIDPADYDYVGVEYDPAAANDMGGCFFQEGQRKVIRAHMERTGGTYSSHEHGGNCMICGAGAVYTVLFYHPKTNTYVRTGGDCAAKMGMGNAADFRALKRGVKEAREAKAGKQKARAYLVGVKLGAAWDIYESEWSEKTPAAQRADENIIRDIVGKLVKYGSISVGQERFISTLMDRIAKRPAIEAARAVERAAAKPCPEGRIEVEVEVIKTEWRDNVYGGSLKMLVKADDGWLAWGTVPDALSLFDFTDGDGYNRQRGLERGDRLALRARFKPSDRDEKFGFFSRPNAKLVQTV